MHFCGQAPWWSGLAAADARAGLESVKPALVCDVVAGQTYWHGGASQASIPATSAVLLPPFDEYLVAYRNRDAVLDPMQVARLNAGGGMLNPCIVVDGQVAGTWRRVLGREEVAIEIELFRVPASPERQAIMIAARRYAAFVERDAGVTIRNRGRAGSRAA